MLARIPTHPLETILCLSLDTTARAFADLQSLTDAIDRGRTRVMDRLYALIPQTTDPSLRGMLLDMKRHVHSKWEPMDERKMDAVCAKAPEVASELRAFQAQLRDRERLRSSCRDAHQQELGEKRAALRATLEDPFVQESLLLSSEGLFKAVKKYLSRSDARPPDKDERDVEMSVVEHLTRASAKTTPRGLLTGVVLGAADPSGADAVQLERRPGASPLAKRKTILAKPEIQALARLCSGEGDAWQYVVPRANSTWYPSGDRIEFWKKDASEDVLCRLPNHPVTRSLLDKAGGRTHTARELVDAVRKEFAPDYGLPELKNHYRRLCEHGVLIGHLEVPFNQLDGLGYLIAWLRGLPAKVRNDALLGELLRLRQLIEKLDASDAPPEDAGRLEAYREIESRLAALLPGHEVAPARSLIVDAVGAWDLRLGKGLADELSDFFDWARRLEHIATEAPEIGAAESAARKLSQRYPGNASVPLMQCYADGALRSDNAWETWQKIYDIERQVEVKDAWSRLIRWVADREKRSGGPLREVRITDEDLASRFPELSGPQKSEGSGSGSALVHVSARTQDDIRTGNYLIVLNGFLPNMLRVISRWAHLFERPPDKSSDGLVDELRKYLRKDARRTPALRASVLFGYDIRTDTAGWHPDYFDKNIELQSARSDFPSAGIIPLKDLYFKWDAAARRVGLFWNKGNRWLAVKPEIVANASVIHPLALLFAKIANWNVPDGSSVFGPNFRKVLRIDHLPRIVRGRVVLIHETWHIPKSDMPPVDAPGEWELFESVNAWRSGRGLPRFVFLRWHKPGEFPESPWLLDFHNPFHLRTLAAYVRRSSENAFFMAQEMLPDPDTVWTRDAKGRYPQEWIVPFVWE